MTALVSLKLKKNEALNEAMISNAFGLELISKWENQNLTSFPSHLKKLILNVKDLSFTSKSIEDCIELEYLRVNGANIPKLSLPRLKKLKTLIISKSNISELDESLLNLQELETLDLSSNNISLLFENANFPNLKRINLDHNNLVELPQWIFRLENINHLSLDENPLSDESKQKLYDHFKIIY